MILRSLLNGGMASGSLNSSGRLAVLGRACLGGQGALRVLENVLDGVLKNILDSVLGAVLEFWLCGRGEDMREQFLT